MEIRLNFSERGLRKLNAYLEGLLKRAKNPGPVMKDMGQYMVRSTKNRLDSTKTSPSGEEWKPLSEVTKKIRAHKGATYGDDDTLRQYGELRQGIYLESSSDYGFTVGSSADHSDYMQSGVARTGGRISGKSIPARPFMGFSDTNLKRMAHMLNKYIAHADSGDFAGEG